MKARTVSAVLAAAMLIVGCSGETQRPAGTGGGTLVFGHSEPATLDPQLTGEQEVTSLLFETLVKLEPGTSRPVPGLASSWDTSDGQTWSFRLERGVRFHDGSAFGAQAVCANFERWYHFTGILQPLAYWRLGFDAYATSADGGPSPGGRYRSCEARATDEVVLGLTKPVGNLPSLLALPPFAIASPDALRRYEADNVSGTREAPRFEGTFGTQHPIGTGPFRFQEWARNETLTVVRNDEYWGERSKLDRVIFRFVAPGARRHALETGEIDGYSRVAPADRSALRSAGHQIVEGRAVNSALLVLNRSISPLEHPTLREAIAVGLNRERVVRALYPPGTETGTQYLPPAVEGHSQEAQVPHDPDRARRLVQESAVENPVLTFTWPSDAGQVEPLIPDPEAIFLSFKADLERVGFTVEGRTMPLQEMITALQAGRLPMFFFPLYSARGEAEDFLRAFKPRSYLPGVEDAAVAALVDQAVAEVDPVKRVALYATANRLVSDLAVVVPFAHLKPATALRHGVSGLRLSVAGSAMLEDVTLK